jgi:hypothetical protein
LTNYSGTDILLSHANKRPDAAPEKKIDILRSRDNALSSGELEAFELSSKLTKSVIRLNQEDSEHLRQKFIYGLYREKFLRFGVKYFFGQTFANPTPSLFQAIHIWEREGKIKSPNRDPRLFALCFFQ